MLDAIRQTLYIMGWLGVALGILSIVNIVCGTISNVNNGESFSWKKLGKGILKIVIFYMSAIFTSIVFTMLPYLNDMIINAFGVVLLSSELLNTLSSIAVLSVVVATIVTQGKKALENVSKLANMTSDVEVITWEVKENEEEPEEEQSNE